jgi:two-component system chemotaxis response regulator CheB
MRPVRILIAEDSQLFASVLRDVIDGEPDMTVIDVVGNGERAVELCQSEEPDLVLMDIRMPKMDGLSATETIMADCPTPILVVTSDPYHGGVDMSFRALSAGALDLMAKPTSFPWPDPQRKTFLRKVRLLAQIPVVRHQRASARRQKRVSYHGRPPNETPGEFPIVGIVGSTGGPRALQRMLGELPESFPAPIVVVQHIIPGFSAHLASWLNSSCALQVSEATDGERMETGHVYLAPAEHHLVIDGGMRLGLQAGEPVSGHVPSGDVLLESLARHTPTRSVGIVLSGMGSDGTTGLAAIHRAGGITLVQDRESSVVYGMPQSAIDIGVVQKVVKLEEFSRTLVSQVKQIRNEL